MSGETPGQAAKPGATAYGRWVNVMATNGVGCNPFESLGNVDQMAWREVEAAQQPQPAPEPAATEALRRFAVDGQWLTCTDDGRLDPRAELLAVRRAVQQALDLPAVAGPAAGTVLLAELRDRMGVGQPVDRPGDQWAETRERPAPELAAARAERDKLQRACITLGWVVDGMARSLRAAWIDIRQGNLEGAAQWVLNSVPDVDDNDPEDQWNGTETSQAWFDRNPLESLAHRTADLKQPQPAPELAYEPDSIDLPSGERDVTEIQVVDAAQLDQLRDRLATLAASLDAEALATQPSKKSQIQADAARRIREALA